MNRREEPSRGPLERNLPPGLRCCSRCETRRARRRDAAARNGSSWDERGEETGPVPSVSCRSPCLMPAGRAPQPEVIRQYRSRRPRGGTRTSSGAGVHSIRQEEFVDQDSSSAIDFAEFTPMRNCAPPSKPLVYHVHSARILLITQRSWRRLGVWRSSRVPGAGSLGPHRRFR